MGAIPDLPERNPGALPAGADPVPASAPAPSMAAAPQAQGTDPLEPVGDSRYSDESAGWVLLADMAFGGIMPWLMASADLAQGRVDEQGFEEARIAHQERLNAMREQHPEFVQAAESALPLLAGVGIGIAKPATTVAGAAGRGAAAGMVPGAVQGYTSGPIEEPSGSSQRMGNAVGGALQGAAQGAVGGATVGGVQKRQRVKAQQQADVEARRADSQRRFEESQRARNEERKRRDNEAEQQQPQQQQQQPQGRPTRTMSDEDLSDIWRTKYTKVPAKPDPNWRKNRDKFMQDPEATFRASAEAGESVADIARKTNMPPTIIADTLSEAQLDRSSPGAKKLFNDLANVLEAKEAHRNLVSRGGVKPLRGRK